MPENATPDPTIQTPLNQGMENTRNQLQFIISEQSECINQDSEEHDGKNFSGKL